MAILGDNHRYTAGSAPQSLLLGCHLAEQCPLAPRQAKGAKQPKHLGAYRPKERALRAACRRGHMLLGLHSAITRSRSLEREIRAPPAQFLSFRTFGGRALPSEGRGARFLPLVGWRSGGSGWKGREMEKKPTQPTAAAARSKLIISKALRHRCPWLRANPKDTAQDAAWRG